MNPSIAPDPDAIAQFAQVLGRIHGELDWPALGQGYCESGGEHFFTDEAVEAIQETGLLFASDLGEALPSGGQSLYLGIGVAEIVPMLFEAIVLKRKVSAYTLPSEEAQALRTVLSPAREEQAWLGIDVHTTPCPQANRPRVDHLWMASVLTDPDAFPALHDHLYERRGTRDATGRGNLPKERKQAVALVHAAWTWLQTPACVTTSQEELVLIREALGASEARLLIPSKARLSAIVGDALVHCNWGP